MKQRTGARLAHLLTIPTRGRRRCRDCTAPLPVTPQSWPRCDRVHFCTGCNGEYEARPWFFGQLGTKVWRLPWAGPEYDPAEEVR